MLLFTTAIDGVSDFLAPLSADASTDVAEADAGGGGGGGDGGGAKTPPPPTASISQAVMSHVALVLDAFAFCLRAMNDPGFIIKVTPNKKAFTLSKLAGKGLKTPIYNVPNLRAGRVVGYLRKRQQFYTTSAARKTINDSTGQSEEWVQLVSGNWIQSKVGSAKQLQVLRDFKVKVHEDMLLQLVDNPTADVSDRFRNIVSPMQFLNGCSVNSQIVVESLAGVFLCLMKLLRGLRHVPDKRLPNRISVAKSCILAACMDLTDDQQLTAFSASNIIDEVLAAGDITPEKQDEEEEDESDKPKEPVMKSQLRLTDASLAPALVSYAEPEASSDTQPMPIAASDLITVVAFEKEFAKLEDGDRWVRTRDTELNQHFFNIIESEASRFNVFIFNALGMPTAESYLEVTAMGPELASIEQPTIGRLNPSDFTVLPEYPNYIHVFRHEDLALCTAVARNVCQLLPAFVYPDMTAPPKPKKEEPKKPSAPKNVDEVQLSVIRDEFCMHLLKTTHRSGSSAHTLASLNKALAQVFISRFRSELEHIQLPNTFSEAACIVEAPDWCNVEVAGEIGRAHV